MERITLLFIFFLLFLNSFCQDWTHPQLDAANTAKEVNNITDV
ncbi:MAG: hypothetical protein JWM28_3495, partial [Chitinophagaceae bacterium]|nr:hypothetical protein [Chitinophagaceae bacterium]